MKTRHLMLISAIVGWGCTAEETARETPQVHTGTIATTTGPIDIVYEIIDGLAVFEGDIIIPWSDFITPNVGHAATTIDATGKKWPNGIVPYEINPNLENPQPVMDAIRHWNERTSVRLVERTTETDFVQFVPPFTETICFSQVGHQGGGQQVILHRDCTTDAVIHEIGHAVGLYHEHTRQDRDEYVTIHWSNIRSDKLNFFNKIELPAMNSEPYDIDSIMHYDSYAFSKGEQDKQYPTITLADNGGLIPRPTELSAGDLHGIASLYPPVPSATFYINGQANGNIMLNAFTPFTLSYISANTVSCDLRGYLNDADWYAVPNFTPSHDWGTTSLGAGHYKWNVVCRNAAGETASAYASLTSVPPPSAMFYINGQVNGNITLTAGAPVFLSYTSTNAVSCDLTGYWNNAVWYTLPNFMASYDWGTSYLIAGDYSWNVVCRNATGQTTSASASLHMQ